MKLVFSNIAENALFLPRVWHFSYKLPGIVWPFKITYDLPLMRVLKKGGVGSLLKGLSVQRAKQHNTQASVTFVMIAFLAGQNTVLFGIWRHSVSPCCLVRLTFVACCNLLRIIYREISLWNSLSCRQVSKSLLPEWNLCCSIIIYLVLSNEVVEKNLKIAQYVSLQQNKRG